MSIHKNLTPTNGIHVPYSFTYANSTTRDAATGLVTADLGKFARQLDTNTIWILTATTPTWKQIGLDLGSAAVTSAYILVADGSDYVGVALSQDATISTAGAISVSDLTIASEARGDILRRNATSWGRLAAKTDKQILIGNGTDVVSVAVSGDATISNAGVVTVAWEPVGEPFFIAGTCYVAENIVYKRVAKAFTLSKVQIAVTTAPTDASIIVDVNYHATDPTSLTTVFTTQASRPEIADAGTTDDSAAPDITAIAAGGFISVSIDQIGSTIAGENLMVTLVAD